MSGWWKRRKLPQSKPDGFASSLPEGASGETGHFAVQPGCAVKRFKMASACALAIISGRKLYIFGIAERLRALRYPIFTGGVVEGNGICSAASYGSAALRASVLALSVSSLRSLPPLPKGEARALPETFSLHLKLQQRAFDLGSPFGRAGAGAPERVRSPGGSCRAATEGL